MNRTDWPYKQDMYANMFGCGLFVLFTRPEMVTRIDTIAIVYQDTNHTHARAVLHTFLLTMPIKMAEERVTTIITDKLTFNSTLM